MGDNADITAALAGLSLSSRKPDLPSFDKRNVEIWTRRVENAFIRANVSTARDKFAYVESKIGVDADHKINKFLYGAATEDNWNNFMAYLKERYGKKDRDKTAAILDPVPRNGRLPSDYIAFLQEKADDVTVEQLIKEKMLRELPNDVRMTISKAVKDLSLEETGRFADEYFAQDGRPIFRNNASVNAVRPPSSTTPTGDANDDETDVNAVRNGARPKQRFDRSASRDQRQKSRPRGNGADYVHQNPDFCYFHDRFGAKARNCHQAGCKFDKAPNGQGPRRA